MNFSMSDSGHFKSISCHSPVRVPPLISRRLIRWCERPTWNKRQLRSSWRRLRARCCLTLSVSLSAHFRLFNLKIHLSSQIDVLLAEVSALKTLVLTSTPSTPNRQLHPQLLSPGSSRASSRPGGHTRNKSASGALQLQTEPTQTDAATNQEDKEVQTHSWKRPRASRD